jgi:hypothetical protein
MVKTGQVWSGLIVCKDATGALATPSVGPAGVLYVDGTANAAAVTVSGANPFKWTCTLPTLTAGQCVSMYITATIATIATASVVAEDVADTVADVPTVAEFEARTLAAASYATAAALAAVDGIVDDILVDTGTTLPAAIAGISSGSAPTVGEIDAQLSATHGAGSWESSSAGSGTGSYTDTITDGTNPLDGVRVQLSTDSAGASTAYEAYTNALGVFAMRPDPGTYYRWLDLAGYSFTQGVEVTVT